MKHHNPDPRHVVHGTTIPSVTYSDQPYLVKADDGAWVCALTTGEGREGTGGQHIITQRSSDFGRTWTDRVQVEPPSGPEASWAVLAKAPNGRLFCFYTYNSDDVRSVPAVDPAFTQSVPPGGTNNDAYYRDGRCYRVDSLGAYAFKISDDNGRSWSTQRWFVPVREFDIDRENATGGAVRFFWNVGRPFVSGDELYLPIHKVGNFGYGFFTRSEGALLRSANVLSVADPTDAQWQTLPEGSVGLRAPTGGGPIAEEHSFVEMSDGSFFCVYRTVAGYPACAYSRDRGLTWSVPQYLTRASGRPAKNPRAANFVWKCHNGNYLYWFHNNGGPVILDSHAVDAGYPYQSPRNPIWFCGGVEVDGPDGAVIQWSEPELMLYDDDPYIRMSYPDLIEDAGRYFVSETNKHLARIHELPVDRLADLWASAAGRSVAIPSDLPAAVPVPAFTMRDNDRVDYGARDLRAGLSVAIEFELATLAPGQVLVDRRDRWGRGVLVATSSDQTVAVQIDDGETRIAWDTDRGEVAAGSRHRLVVIVDGGPHLVSFVLDGRFLDGGRERQCGWGRFSAFVKQIGMGPAAAPRLAGAGRVESVRFFDRALSVAQAVTLSRPPQSSR